jgi:hypothetical protein
MRYGIVLYALVVCVVVVGLYGCAVVNVAVDSPDPPACVTRSEGNVSIGVKIDCTEPDDEAFLDYE